jgi:hypothetical protein
MAITAAAKKPATTIPTRNRFEDGKLASPIIFRAPYALYAKYYYTIIFPILVLFVTNGIRMARQIGQHLASSGTQTGFEMAPLHAISPIKDSALYEVSALRALPGR